LLKNPTGGEIICFSINPAALSAYTNAALYDGVLTSVNTRCSEPNDGNNTGNYCVGIAAADADPATNKAGFYTFTAKVGTSSVIYATTTFKMRYVTSAADSGAVITVAAAGNLTVGSNYQNSSTLSATDYIKATLRDANAGYVITADTTTISSVSPCVILKCITLVSADCLTILPNCSSVWMVSYR
jgi:hypothetical protein